MTSQDWIAKWNSDGYMTRVEEHNGTTYVYLKKPQGHWWGCIRFLPDGSMLEGEGETNP